MNKKPFPSTQPAHEAKSATVRRAARILSRSKHARLWKSVSGCLAGGLVFAVAGTSWGATYTYTPTGTTSDTFSGSTDWTPSAPVSDPSTELTFVGTNTTVLTAATSTVTDDDNGAFQLNILDLQGTGPASSTATINIAGAAATNYLDFVSNNGTTPVVNLNAIKGNGLTYNVTTSLQFDANTTFQGNGTATFNFAGATGATFAGSGNITKSGTSTVTLAPTTATESYTGSVNINGGTLSLSNIYSPGTVAIGSSGTLSSGSSFAFSAVSGTGTISTTSNHNLTINYNGAGSDNNFTGAIAGGSIAKAGVGVLDLTGVKGYTDSTSTTTGFSGSSSGSNDTLVMEGGTLDVTSLAGAHVLTFGNGTINVTPGNTGTAASPQNIFTGSTQNATGNLPGTLLSIAPTGSAANVALTALSGATTNNAQPIRASGGTIALDPGSNNSVTLTIGNTALLGGTSTAAAVTENGVSGHGLIIAPATGIVHLGSTAASGVRVNVVEGSTNTDATDTTTNVNGMVEAGVVGQDNDTNKSGYFLTYSGTHTSSDVGFTQAGYTDTNFATPAATGREHVTSAVSGLGATQVYSLQNDGQTIMQTTGTTLTLGDGVSTHQAGLIMNGGSISGGTVAFGASNGAIYVSGANASIGSAITGSASVNIQGPGVLSLTGSLTGLSNGVYVMGSTLETSIATLATLSNAGLDLENGVYQSNGGGNFTRGLGNPNTPGAVNFSNLGTGSGGGFAARNGNLTVNLGGSATPSQVVWGTTSNFIADGGTLMFGSSTADSTVTFTNPLSLGGNSPYYTRIINVAKNPTAGTNDMAVISGVITTGTGGTSTTNGTGGSINILAKTGAGTLALTGNNLYTGGTVVNQGTLLVNNTAGSGTGTGAVSIVGGTLGGSGSIGGATTVSTGANITGGTVGAVGTLTLVSLTLNSGSTNLIDIGTGASSDKLAISGAFLSSGATFKINSGMLDGTDNYTIATYASDTGSSFSFTNLPSNYSVLDTGTALELVAAVPEPSTWVGGLLTLGIIGYVQRRRFGAKSVV